MKKTMLTLGLLTIAWSANAADPELAKAIIKEKCHLCHGMEGESSNAIYPRLAGQNHNYLVKQLKNFRDGKRKSDTMNEMTKGLLDEEIEALAKYFSSKPALSHRVRDKGFSAVGEYLYKKGNKYSGIPSCKSCHGEFGRGSDDLPRLAGQHKRYVADQLHAFGERIRTNDNTIMHTIANKLTELEIEALALYVSGIKVEAPEESEAAKEPEQRQL